MFKTAAGARSCACSNKLYRGEVSSAEEALRTVVDGMDAEVEDTRLWNASLRPDEQRHRLSPTVFVTYRAVAHQALAIWRDEVKAAEKRAIERIRALGGNDAEQIADALEAEAYDGLAW